MRRIPIVPLAVGAIVVISGGVASGLSAIGIGTAIHNCQNSNLTSETRIEACNVAIHTNLAPHGILARFYYARALAYESANDFDRAKKDYDKALELKPGFAEAQANRAHLMVSTHPTPQ